MKTFSTKTSIQATPEAVRRILTDASAYSTWDPTYSRIDGRIALGEKITLHHASLAGVY